VGRVGKHECCNARIVRCCNATGIRGILFHSPTARRSSTSAASIRGRIRACPRRVPSTRARSRLLQGGRHAPAHAPPVVCHLCTTPAPVSSRPPSPTCTCTCTHCCVHLHTLYVCTMCAPAPAPAHTVCAPAPVPSPSPSPSPSPTYTPRPAHLLHTRCGTRARQAAMASERSRARLAPSWEVVHAREEKRMRNAIAEGRVATKALL